MQLFHLKFAVTSVMKIYGTMWDFFSISNCFTHFYIQQDNIKKLTKKKYKNKQQHKNKTLLTFENDEG